MKTYSDLQEAIAKGRTGDFLLEAVRDHQGSKAYKDAVAGQEYYNKHNTTVERYVKVLHTLSGRSVPDIFSANWKLKSLVFRRLVQQQCGYVLANGMQMDGKERLGAGFDNKLMQAAKKALSQGVAYGYWNNDHVEIFSFADTPNSPGFVPLCDENTSEMKAGIRYWFRTAGNDTIFRATLYTLEGVAEWGGTQGKDIVELSPIRGYKRHTLRNEAMGVIDQCDENYTRLPIAILWGNDTHESELVGLREKIDCYDLIESGLANNIDDASEIYWILTNTGGMDDVDLAQFLQRIRTAHGATLDGGDGVRADAHTMQIPTEARKTMLEILRKDIYEDAQMLDVVSFGSGEKTTVEINAAYQGQDNKCADFEYSLIDFIEQICDIAGIQNPEPKFIWNKVINQREQTEMVLSAAPYLDEEAVLSKLPWLLPEEVDEILKRKSAEELDRRDDESEENPEDVNENGES